MSITREEAIKELERLLSHWDDLENGKRSFRWYSKDAVGLAITALRPVSREQVERMFPGCPGCDSVSSKWEIRFCPFCGKPRTDEAVEMVMERLEALHETDLI